MSGFGRKTSLGLGEGTVRDHRTVGARADVE